MKRAFLALLAAATLVGCARTSGVTEVSSDASWKRTVTIEYSGSMMTEEDPAELLKKKFRLPSGAGWTTKVEKSEDNSSATFTGSRAYAAGEGAAADIVLLAEEKPTMSNAITVRKVDEKTFEYREKFSWLAVRAAVKNLEDVRKSVREAFGARAEGLADAELDRFADRVTLQTVRALFGPADPLIFNLMSQPELGERKINKVLAEAMDKALVEIFPDRFDAAARREMVRAMLKTEPFKAMTPTTEDAQAGPNKDLMVFTLSVKLPGEITETNGDVDPLTGEAYWGFLAESVEFADVELYAMSKVP